MITRRKFLKNSIITTAASAVYINSPIQLHAKEDKKIQTKWDSSICKFCSIGCGILVGTQNIDNRKTIVSIKGDELSTVNNGELCSKGFHNGSILYSKDRLTTPLLRMTNNKYDKNGKLTPITWLKAFDIMEEKAKKALLTSGVDGVGLYTSGQTSIYHGYALSKLYKAGFRSNNISNSSSFSSEVASNALNTIYGTNTPSGSFNDIALSDTFVSWGVNLIETYPIIYSKVLKAKDKNKKYKFINITTIKNQTSKDANEEIFIKPNKDILLINYLAHEFIYNNEDKIDWSFIKRHTIFAKLGDIKINTDDDRYEHWEISYKNYKKSLKKYTLDYVASKLKADEKENINEFKNKLKELSSYYIDAKTRVLSYWSSGINKQENSFQTNLALNSLHLLLNKHSRAGCGAYPLNGQASSAGTSNELGLYSSKLPSNMFIKYKEHRTKTEAIWNIPEGTLNSVCSNNKDNLFNNIMNNTTKFVWITNTNPYQSDSLYLNNINKIQEIEDLFVVTSDCYGSITSSLSDLILPTAEHLETSGAFGNTERRIQQWNQQIEPEGMSMSDLWQCLEFSKRFKVKDTWGNAKLSNGQGLKDIVIDSYKYGYEENTNLFKILFSSKRSHSFSKEENILNSEVNGDSRNILGSDGVIFEGYGFFIQKYLFEEYRLFGSAAGFDIGSFSTSNDYTSKKWPYLFDKETKYIFNPRDDIYANKAAKLKDTYIFYGKMGVKALPFGNLNKITNEKTKSLKYRAKIFAIPYIKSDNVKKDKLLLTSIKLEEQSNTGTLTMRVPELYSKTMQSYGYISKKTAKQYNLIHDDLCYIKSSLGKIKIRISIDKRFTPSTNTIAVALFDEKVLINKVTKSINNTYVALEKIKEEK
ncbi:MAG TPA: hypothetical protein EYG73_03270 [Arcobacter sp.]|nr:hypothetical protein [Arcobacter sp.]